MDIDLLRSRINSIKQDILNNCRDKSMPPQLVAVSKTVDSNTINLLSQLQHFDIGENRAQAIVEKYDKIDKNMRIHCIGRLQTNKIRYIIDKVVLVHSLDRINLAEELNAQASKHQIILPVLVQVNIARESQKAGFEVAEALSFIKSSRKYSSLKIKGLMAIMPNIDNELELAVYFRQMRKLFDGIKDEAMQGVEMETLSMGMSNDYKIAAYEGSTMLRIGSALFNE